MQYFRKRMRSTRFLLVSAAVGIVVLAGAAVAVLAPVASAAKSSCLVVDATSNISYTCLHRSRDAQQQHRKQQQRWRRWRL
jgi:hypothetical protein